MDNAELRRYCDGVVEKLDVPDRADVNALCDRLEELRGRPISLVEIPMPTGHGKPCGLWVATDDEDFICYQRFTTQAHQQHIVRHEIGHMLCGHEAAPVMPDEVVQLLMPTLSPDLVRSVLGRTQYSTEEERMAELVASLMPASAMSARIQTSVSPGVANLMTHLGRSLERHSGT
ncbi:toxin (plasmid) [Streptomyces sp. NBC_01278]|uniref:toxin n=1 Tax=Streptomyces sp. NBC_01278 TaxID=2903809 RepID=UPI002E33F336|nr:toxin [Streptomyces sp. NBC_01278]